MGGRGLLGGVPKGVPIGILWGGGGVIRGVPKGGSKGSSYRGPMGGLGSMGGIPHGGSQRRSQNGVPIGVLWEWRGAHGGSQRGFPLGSYEREGSLRGVPKGVPKGVPIEILWGGPWGGPKREFPPPIWGGTHVGVPKGSYGGERSLGEGPKGGSQRGFP